MKGPTGIAIVDKEPGWTSHDVVAKARGIFGTRKVGHSGTLDPDATGVLLLGVGGATRVLRFLNVLPKSYEAEIVLGTETDTLDSSGEVTACHEMPDATFESARAVAAKLVGNIMQVLPMVSAVKIDGKRLHQLAREGKEVERPARSVRIDRFELFETLEPQVFGARVTCSTGTFVRVLAADLGHSLGGGAHLRNLRRTAIGSFTVEEARPLDRVELLPAATAVRDLDPVTVDAATATDVTFGRVIPRDRLGVCGEAPYPLIDANGELLAVYEPYRDDMIKPAVVFAQPVKLTPQDPK